MFAMSRTPFVTLCLSVILCSFCGPESFREDVAPLPQGPQIDDPWGPLGPPQIDSVSPLRGSNCGGSLLVIEGRHFTSQTTVSVGGIAATSVSVISGTRLSARVPAQRTINGPAHVSVQNPDGSWAQFGEPFLYQDCRLELPNRKILGALEIVADFNLDGRPDFVTNHPGVVLNEGKGDFSVPRLIDDLGFQPKIAVVADWNRDGKPDLAFAAPSSFQIAVVLGDGTGRFGPPMLVTTYTGSSLQQLVVGDWNGDGFPDLATNHGGQLWTFLGDGLGGFGPPSILLSSIASMTGVVAGDWDKDSRDDLAYCRSTQSVKVRLSTGTGTFGPESSFAAGSATVATLVAMDADGDQALDLVASGGSAGAILLRGDGRGAFAAGVRLSPTGFIVGRIGVGDLNKDQKPDLIINGTMTNSNNRTWILFGDGMGGFSGLIGYPVPSDGLATIAVPSIADMDGDSNPDLITADGISLGDGTGYFYTPTYLGAITGPVVIGTVDQDPYVDIVGDQGAKVMLGNGKGGIRSISYGTPFPSWSWVAPVLADVNGDSNLDMIANQGYGGSSPGYWPGIKYGDGKGGFSDSSNLGISSTAPYQIVAGYFDKDLTSDLVLLNNTGQFATLVLGSVTGDLSRRTTVELSGAVSNDMVIGDFNSDRRADLAISQSDLVSGQPGAIVVLLGDGMGGFSKITRWPTREGAGSLAAGDVNGDGRLDLVYVNNLGGGSGLLFGDGAGNFSGETSFPTEPGLGCIRLVDLNGDQRLDLVAGHPLLTVQLGDGMGSFERPRSYGGPGCPLNIGDLTGDRQPDVVLGGNLFPSQKPFSQ